MNHKRVALQVLKYKCSKYSNCAVILENDSYFSLKSTYFMLISIWYAGCTITNLSARYIHNQHALALHLYHQHPGLTAIISNLD